MSRAALARRYRECAARKAQVAADIDRGDYSFPHPHAPYNYVAAWPVTANGWRVLAAEDARLAAWHEGRA